ncbi:hypothetical protein SLS62_011434 [Diatrype stigma]|uniref:Uncharacterized protein n=1 Tax=Diatrype stigma TaxID=117547 RepID=A0AAN9U2K5_9PEZI
MNGHQDPTALHRAAIVEEVEVMVAVDKHVQTAPVGQATWFAGSTHDGGATILIIQAESDQEVLLGPDEWDQFRPELEALADEDDHDGLVKTFAGCKWAFYDTAHPQNHLTYDPEEDNVVDDWNLLLAKIDLREYSKVNHLFFDESSELKSSQHSG